MWIRYGSDAMLTTLNIVLLLLNAAFIGVGIYLSSYLKKKAEHLATREDFKELQAQTAALTQTTKEIEAKISSDVWDRQKRWELKQEVLFAAASRVAAVFDALKTLENILQTEIKNPAIKNQAWVEMSVDENAKWFKATAALSESQLFVGVTCGNDVQLAISDFSRMTTVIAAKINKDDGAIFRQSFQQLLTLQDNIREAIRKELKIDPHPMAAAPSPAKES